MLKTKTRLYNTWRGMKERCTSPTHKNYVLYKDKLCEEWYDSETFMKWAKQNGYKEGLTIDRIDSNKGYYPKNCQFITAKENTIKGNKERRLRIYEYKKKQYTCKELSELTGMDYDRLHQRLTRQKYSVEESLTRKWRNSAK